MEGKNPVAPAITCGPENVEHFNARFRTEMPEFFALAKALRERGLIEGLRGARIGPLGSLPTGEQPVTSIAAETRLADRVWAQQKGGRK